MEIIKSGVIFLFSALVAWAVFYLFQHIKRRSSDKFLNSTIFLILDSLVNPFAFLIFILGVISALLLADSLETWHGGLITTAVASIIIAGTYGAVRIFDSLLNWQLARMKDRAKKPIDLGAAMFLKRFIQILMYAFGLLFLLDYLGIPISPLIASLGIGGLAVALALQPTLANFFAGAQIISDRVARVGDFIEIDENTRGYVVDVGWRSTRIRTPFNNVIILPNSLLANSQVTNYNIPNPGLAVSVYCGVSYDSDLAYVKKGALEVANETVEQMDEAVKTFEPMVAFDNFDESNIVFWVWIQAKDRLSSFFLKSGLIMRLQERFKAENIRINYPVRQTYINWPQGASPNNMNLKKQAKE